MAGYNADPAPGTVIGPLSVGWDLQFWSDSIENWKSGRLGVLKRILMWEIANFENFVIFHLFW